MQGHLAFCAADAAIDLAIIAYAMPQLRGWAPHDQVLNMGSLWLMTGSIGFMTFLLAIAGTIQTHMQRLVGDQRLGVQGPCNSSMPRSSPA